MTYNHIYLSKEYPDCEFIRISLTAVAIVDKEFAWLKKYSWHLCNGYARRIVNAKRGRNRFYFLHHYILPKKYNNGLFVDHINGNILDNRKCNLRYATPLQSAQNKSPKRGKAYKGVHKESLNKYTSQITANYQRYKLGKYTSELEAAQVYNKAAKQYHGEYARLNTI